MFRSMLDTDLYKLTMGQAVAQHYPRAEAEYTLFLRDKVAFPAGFASRLSEAVRRAANLSPLSSNMIEFLRQRCSFLTPFYADFLAGYRYDPQEVFISQLDGILSVKVEGPWYRTIFWEVPLLAAISEMYHRDMSPSAAYKDALDRLDEKIKRLGELRVPFAEGGTRRRYGSDLHRYIVKRLSAAPGFVGTSNLEFAYENRIRPIGTQAHEWFMFHGAQFGYRMANKLAMDRWVDTYHGSLGIALGDTYTTGAFLRDFGPEYARLFDGVRQDSGDPIEVGEKIVTHYKSLGIDPMSKTIVFSDGLNVDKIEKIVSRFRDRVKVSFLIGTDLTCDVPGVKPLNMVIKLTACRMSFLHPWRQTVKLSDVPTKNTGDREEVDLCKRTLGLA